MRLPDKKLTPFIAGFAVLWCLGIGAFSAFVYRTVLRQRHVQEHFAVSQGTIETSRVDSQVISEIRNGDSYDVTYYRPKLAYHYTVGDRSFVSSRYTYDDSGQSDPTYARRIAAEYPVGRTVTVYYDPENPGESVLESSVPPTITHMLLFLRSCWAAGIILVLIAVHLALLAGRIRRYDPTQDHFPCPIPGWGTLRRTGNGWVIRRRPRVLLSIAFAYCLTTFLTLFVLWALGLSYSATAQERALYACLGISLVAGGAAFWMDGSKVSVDWSRRTVAIRRRSIVQEMTVDEVAAVCVGWLKARSQALSLYLKSHSGKTVRLNVFDLGKDNPHVTREVAQHVARLLGKSVEANS